VFVYWNDGTQSRQNGYLTQADITVHLDTLYADFRLRGVNFVLTTIRPFQFTDKAKWMAYTVPSDSARTQAKALSQLVRGDIGTRTVQDLFIYSVFDISDGTAAFASLPDMWETNSNIVLADGVFVAHRFISGGSSYMKHILSHEVGLDVPVWTFLSRTDWSLGQSQVVLLSSRL
jgi:hypothetical protein